MSQRPNISDSDLASVLIDPPYESLPAGLAKISAKERLERREKVSAVPQTPKEELEKDFNQAAIHCQRVVQSMDALSDAFLHQAKHPDECGAQIAALMLLSGTIESLKSLQISLRGILLMHLLHNHELTVAEKDYVTDCLVHLAQETAKKRIEALINSFMKGAGL